MSMLYLKPLRGLDVPYLPLAAAEHQWARCPVALVDSVVYIAVLIASELRDRLLAYSHSFTAKLGDYLDFSFDVLIEFVEFF